jgi:N-glycosylase/DNA lyase
MRAIAKPASEILLLVRDYDLAATLNSGQVFRWQHQDGSWIGVVGRHRVCLTQTRDGIRAETAGAATDWQWLRDYLQADVDLNAVLQTFPDDAPLRDAVAACRGLRLLRQDPWECLASFMLSSTKQIVQIRQIVTALCEQFGEPINATMVGRAVPCAPPTVNEHGQIHPAGAHGVTRPTRQRVSNYPSANSCLHYSFPTPERLAAATESELRACKMGFRAPHLLQAARRIAEGQLDLQRLHRLAYAEARDALMQLKGVGDKIADCVLLFAYGFDAAFPVDVWVERALRELYFPRRRVSHQQLRQFAATHFGPHAGYAQQYLFHYMRTKMK